MLLLRLLHFSPSTATGRHDSHRAALAFVWFAREAVKESGADIAVELVWALPAITSKPQVQALLATADLLVLASPTYAQGSPWFVRRFLELGAGLQLWGKLGTAFATAGGQNTGGDVTVADTLRSWTGLGMCVFTFAQKHVVFGAQQKFTEDGEFELIDVWFLRQLARTCVLQLLARGEPSQAGNWARRLGLETGYYNAFPTESELAALLGDVCSHLNAPLGEGAAAYAWWSNALGFDAAPPDASGLPFAALLPEAIPK
jgi:multimeric flavodoxin WrbA